MKGGGVHALPFSLPMINLTPNSADQVIYVSPFEARKYLATFTHYLFVLRSQASQNEYKCILNTTIDNARYTKATMPTNANDATAGKILLKESGLFTYTIYGQTNGTNTDPSDAVVVGTCETGVAMASSDAAWTTPDLSIPDNIVYYE